jgi:exodeoxyribonuclease-5
MTEDQQRAREFLLEFEQIDIPRYGKSVHACLEGYAGVGKTWLVGHWLQGLHARRPTLRVLVAAPTNKAVDVLRGKCGHVDNVEFKTLDGYLGYRMRRDEDNQLQRIKSGKAMEYDLVVVDEASMVKAGMHTELMQQGVRLLYVGDPKQLLPIGEGLSPSFDTPRKCIMREPTRQAADSPIHALATFFRDRVDDGGMFVLQDVRAMLPEDKRITFTRSNSVLDWYETALDRELDARMLAFDNATVWDNNMRMHARRFPGCPLFGPGEMALVNETFEVNDDIMLCNGDTLKVLSCVPAEPVAGVAVHDVELVNPCRLSVNGTELGDSIVVQVAENWAEAERTHRMLTDGIYACRRSGNIAEVDRLLDLRRPLHKLAPLRHSYASTVHKAQGSTYDVAFVDWGSIYRSREMRARLMYVAATRPSQYLIVATN